MSADAQYRQSMLTIEYDSILWMAHCLRYRTKVSLDAGRLRTYLGIAVFISSAVGRGGDIGPFAIHTIFFEPDVVVRLTPQSVHG